jgi:hypothetical protein
MGVLTAACESTDLGTAVVVVAGFVLLAFVFWAASR